MVTVVTVHGSLARLPGRGLWPSGAPSLDGLCPQKKLGQSRKGLMLPLLQSLPAEVRLVP